MIELVELNGTKGEWSWALSRKSLSEINWIVQVEVAIIGSSSYLDIFVRLFLWSLFLLALGTSFLGSLCLLLGSSLKESFLLLGGPEDSESSFPDTDLV